MRAWGDERRRRVRAIFPRSPKRDEWVTHPLGARFAALRLYDDGGWAMRAGRSAVIDVAYCDGEGERRDKRQATHIGVWF